MTYLDEVKALPHLNPISAWDVRREHLRMLLLEHEDWGKFKEWSTVGAALYSGMIPSIEEERRSCGGTMWRTLLQNFGDENGTAVRQAYSLSRYEDITGRQLTSEDQFVEFGGGYGEMARMVFLACNPMSYTIYDFPVLGILQRWYLSNFLGLRLNSVKTTFDADDIPPEPMILISICGISEAPIEDKIMFLDKVHADSMLIRYQENWDAVNNREFLHEYANKWYKNVYDEEAPQFKSHHYLIAWDRK